MAVDLALSKTADVATTSPAHDITYTLDYQNLGTTGATGVVVTENLPANTQFIAANNPGWVQVSPGVYKFDVGAVAAGGHGSATFVASVKFTIPAGVETIDNTASITDDGANGADAISSDNSDFVSTPLDAAPNLIIEKTDGDVVSHPGETITYTLTARNFGPQDATNVTITETVPTNTTFNAAASDPGWTQTGPSTYEFHIASMPASFSASVVVVFAVDVDDPVPASTVITNTATISDGDANGPDVAPENNTDTETTGVNGPVDLSVTKVNNVGGSIALSESFTWTFTITNNGPGTAFFNSGDTLFLDNLPDTGITYTNLDLSQTGGSGLGSAGFFNGDLIVTMNADSFMEPGGTVTVVVFATPTRGIL